MSLQPVVVRLAIALLLALAFTTVDQTRPASRYLLGEELTSARRVAVSSPSLVMDVTKPDDFNGYRAIAAVNRTCLEWGSHISLSHRLVGQSRYGVSSTVAARLF